MSKTFYAINRTNKTCAVVTGVTCWEQLQGMFRVGILLPDNSNANAIGRAKDQKDFERKAGVAKFTILK